MICATPEEVNRNVALTLKSRRISQQHAGDLIGKSRAIISNQLSSKRYFSKQLASLFSSAFGFQINYLLYGTGDLLNKQAIHDLVEVPTAGPKSDEGTEAAIMASLIDIAENIIRIQGDNDALAAWHAVSRGDFEDYKRHMKSLSESHGGVTYNSILARFVCDRIQGKAYIPVVTDLDSATGQKEQ